MHRDPAPDHALARVRPRPGATKPRGAAAEPGGEAMAPAACPHARLVLDARGGACATTPALRGRLARMIRRARCPAVRAGSILGVVLADLTVHWVVARQQAKVALRDGLQARDHLRKHICHTRRPSESPTVKPVGRVRLGVHDEIVGVLLLMVLAEAKVLSADSFVVRVVAQVGPGVASRRDAIPLREVLVVCVRRLLEVEHRACLLAGLGGCLRSAVKST
mmetsp:Transcript_10558/g.28705  ORF Transcript_10558/g.28705 Transcript_10558/m.28705 type:complete len:221 (-) Transcript_10558:32-694(-)